MRKPRIGILSTFTGSDFGYSLVVCVHAQLQMLLQAGYQPVLFAAPTFTGTGVFADTTIDIRRHITLDASATDILAALRPLIGDIDIMICHDLLFLHQHREWATALRTLAVEYPHIAWLHWQHSRGDHAPVERMERSWFCYPNMGDLGHVATINSTDMGHVRYIPHPLDFGYLGWPPLAIQIAEEYGFPFADVSMIMPSRLDRHKQIDKLVRIFAGLKQAGRSVCLLVSDAYATGDHFVAYKRECEALAAQLGLTDHEFAFLGEQYEECRYSTPREVVKALFEMSNLFIQPSTSETSSLVVMEAALAGCMVIINADFPPIHHLYRKALTLPFGSIFEKTKYYRDVKTADGQTTHVLDDQLYWSDRAKDTILPALDAQITIQLKRQQLRERWPSRVFTEHLEPLIAQVWQEVGEPDRAPACGDREVTAIITTIDNLPMLKRQVEILQHEVGQIIVVNNGSVDGTREWLEEDRDIAGTYINRENMGAGPGRNAGLDAWDNSTPYTLMLDGGILPPIGAVREMKKILDLHPEIDVISPEVDSCFTTDEAEAMHVATPLPDLHFPQRCISSTAFALCRARAWDNVRLSEEGPFGQPGWGVDDQDLQYRWNDANVLHHDFTYRESGWKLYRRRSGSFPRLFAETGIWPNQYGSVYEQRNVKTYQDWYKYHSWVLGWREAPSASFVIEGVPMPEFARIVKLLHDRDKDCEVVCFNDGDPDVKRWLDTFALRWPWGDCTIDPDGRILRRGVDYPEELWSGNVVRNRGPLVEAAVITPANMEEYLDLDHTEREHVHQAA